MNGFKEPLEKPIEKTRSRLKELESFLKEFKLSCLEIDAKQINNEIEFMKSRVNKLREIAPKCTEQDELLLKIYKDWIVEPHLQFIEEVKDRISEYKNKINQNKLELDSKKDELKQHEIFISFLEKFNEDSILPYQPDVKESLQSNWEILNKHYKILQDSLEELEKLQKNAESIETSLNELKKDELIHEWKEEIHTHFQELPGSKPNEHRVKEREVKVRKCMRCGAEEKISRG